MEAGRCSPRVGAAISIFEANNVAVAQKRGIDNSYTLAYQSRVGPVEWLKPYTDETIRRLGAQVRLQF